MMFTSLEPGAFYWARRKDSNDNRPIVVQISTLFGEDKEYWTLATMGSDQHHMPGAFAILEKITEPSASLGRRQAAE